MGRGHLDEVAQQIVVADLERADAGLAPVALLSAAMCRRLWSRSWRSSSSSGRSPARTKPPSRASSGSIVLEAQPQLLDQRLPAASAQRRWRRAPARRRRCSRSVPAVSSAVRPRPAGRAARRGPAPGGRAPGRGPGSGAVLRARSVAALAGGDAKLSTSSRRARIASGSVSGAASRSASSRPPAFGDGAVDRGQQRALAVAARLLCSSRLRRVAGSISITLSRLDPARPVEARQQALLGQLEIARAARRRPRARPGRRRRSPSSVATSNAAHRRRSAAMLSKLASGSGVTRRRPRATGPRARPAAARGTRSSPAASGPVRRAAPPARPAR